MVFRNQSDTNHLQKCLENTFTLVPCLILMKHHLFNNFSVTSLLKITGFLLSVTLRGATLVYQDVSLSSPFYIQIMSFNLFSAVILYCMFSFLVDFIFLLLSYFFHLISNSVLSMVWGNE